MDSRRSRQMGVLLAIVSTLVSLCLLLGAEGWLRWLDPTPPDAIYEQFLEQSRKYLEPCAALTRLDRSARDRPRVVVIGESSGELVGDALKRLEHAGAAVQIANCAQGGSAFLTLTERFDEVIAARPEAIIIVFGHNYDFEAPLTGWQIRIQYLRLHSKLMSKLMTWAGGGPPRLPLRVANDLAPFEAFLRRAAIASREQKVRLVFSTMASNYLYPPIQDAQASPALYAARLQRMRDAAPGARQLAQVVAAGADGGA
ncbi:MAG: SGNH/GDSL hydrolase family protein, partial [Deltaproteobacteria bacterium]|nr:SGNH/GDSL hydrolase family protein [Deltaproteobacteria bacterium]